MFKIWCSPQLRLQGHVLWPCPCPLVISFSKNDTRVKTFTPLHILPVAAPPLPVLSVYPAYTNSLRGPRLNTVNTHKHTNTGSSPGPCVPALKAIWPASPLMLSSVRLSVHSFVHSDFKRNLLSIGAACGGT